MDLMLPFLFSLEQEILDEQLLDLKFPQREGLYDAVSTRSHCSTRNLSVLHLQIMLETPLGVGGFLFTCFSRSCTDSLRIPRLSSSSASDVAILNSLSFPTFPLPILQCGVPDDESLDDVGLLALCCDLLVESRASCLAFQLTLSLLGFLF